jgi:adenylate cyclase
MDEQLTVAFVDLAGFTTMTVAHGDETGASVAELFASMARTELFGDEALVKSLGDAVMLTAPSPTEGLALVGRICARADAEPAFPVLRTGLHHGPVVRRGDDWFGTTVNTAARIAARAAGGQALGTRLFADAAETLHMDVLSLGPIPLRGLPEPLELFELVPCPTVVDRVEDPVCRMAVHRSKAAGRLTYHDHEFLFCSLECVSAFARTPHLYVGTTA